MRAHLALAALLILPICACAPRSQPPAARLVALDCAQPFAAQAARIAAQPGLNPAPKDPAEPYRFYSSADGSVSWLITEPGAPGHPAIMMQRAVGHDVQTTGCPYGDAKGYAQLRAYLDSLNAWRR